jgi:3-hydroxymyristoyl/3-hydroxydecanoyl-(acyl carrier protein) dehydratase
VTETALVIARDHPAYDGHFPARPILPAVVLLAEALAVIENEFGVRPRSHLPRSGSDPEFSVSSAKFLRPVAPGTALTLAHEASGDGVRFEIRSADGVVASGVLARAAG